MEGYNGRNGCRRQLFQFNQLLTINSVWRGLSCHHFLLQLQLQPSVGVGFDSRTGHDSHSTNNLLCFYYLMKLMVRTPRESRAVFYRQLNNIIYNMETTDKLLLRLVGSIADRLTDNQVIAALLVMATVATLYNMLH